MRKLTYPELTKLAHTKALITKVYELETKMNEDFEKIQDLEMQLTTLKDNYQANYLNIFNGENND